MSSGSADPWAWLGLLKWSLSYTDGTSDTTPTPMSAEDKAFLEKVMKEGIINENERMKEILTQVTSLMEIWKTSKYSSDQEETAQELLEELRDIVEQIDFARAFSAMKGLDFLLGCVGERQAMPESVRVLCLGILATMCQNNPPVQKQLLEMGSLKILSDLFFQEEQDAATNGKDEGGLVRAKVIQAISANVRSHDLAEAVFSQLDQTLALLEHGLGAQHNGSTEAPIILQKRTLFLVRALLTSDSASLERIRTFQSILCWIADNLVKIANEESSLEIREISLETIRSILEQKKSVNAVLSRKNSLVAAGIQRVAVIRTFSGEDLELSSLELELWESTIALLARAEPDTVAPTAPTLLLEEGSSKDAVLPQ